MREKFQRDNYNKRNWHFQQGVYCCDARVYAFILLFLEIIFYALTTHYSPPYTRNNNIISPLSGHILTGHNHKLLLPLLVSLLLAFGLSDSVFFSFYP